MVCGICINVNMKMHSLLQFLMGIIFVISSQRGKEESNTGLMYLVFKKHRHISHLQRLRL